MLVQLANALKMSSSKLKVIAHWSWSKEELKGGADAPALTWTPLPLRRPAMTLTLDL